MIRMKTSLILTTLAFLTISCDVDLEKENKKIKTELAETRKRLEEKEQEKNNEMLRNEELKKHVELAQQILDSKVSEDTKDLNREIEATKQALDAKKQELTTKDQELGDLKSDAESAKQTLAAKDAQVAKMQKALPKVLSKNQDTLNNFLYEFLTLSGKLNKGTGLTSLEQKRYDELDEFFANLSDKIKNDFDLEVN